MNSLMCYSRDENLISELRLENTFSISMRTKIISPLKNKFDPQKISRPQDEINLQENLKSTEKGRTKIT